uniref:AIR synthase-related protein n=1 Tax=Acinetobacter baumannii TaxID=470 RepID=UPI002090DE7B
VFGWLAKVGGLDQAEMVRTFNCGIGMVVVTAPADAERLIAAFEAAGEAVVTLGQVVVATEEPLVTFAGALTL